MKEEGANVKLLSLGVGPLISREQQARIQQYEDMRMAHRAVPDRHEQARLALYMSNVSQSSATSLDTARHAIEARRTEAGGSAKTEVATRSRKQTIQRKNLKKRRKDVEADLDTANLLEKDGKETFSKFRSCCNTASKIKESNDEFITYLGSEDRWQNDRDYRARRIKNGYLPD